MTEKFGTEMYDSKYAGQEVHKPRGIVKYFVDKYLIQSKNCLDLGSGMGRHSRYIAEKGVNVTAIDLSEKGVEKTKEALKDFPNSHVLVGDIHNLPFENESFDSLICNRVLDYNDDKGLEIAFAEIERVVKNAGIIFVTLRAASQPLKKEEILITENENGGKSFKVESGPEKGAFQHYFTEKEIRALATEHNFDIVEIREDQSINDENKAKAEWQAVMKKINRQDN